MWVDEKSLNWERNKKRETENLDKMTGEETSQPREKEKKKIEKKFGHWMSAKKGQPGVGKITGGF